METTHTPFPPLKIGDLDLGSPVIVAPIAGYTDQAFRTVMREHTNSLMFAEMVSVSGLREKAKNTMRRIQRDEKHSPLGVQLFGCLPELFYDGARFVQDSGVELVDVNFGCPKVPGEQLAGSRLMQYPERVAKIVSNMRHGAPDIPVTVKMRAGMDDNRINCVEIARIAEEEGADAVTVHGRTCGQKFSGKSNWDWIKAVVDAVDIPVIANGDIDSPEKAAQVLEYTGAAGVMIGRASLGKQWLIANMARYLRGESVLPPPSVEDTRDQVLRHLEYTRTLLGPMYLQQTMRKVVSTYFKKVPKVRHLRRAVHKIRDYDKLKRVLKAFPERIPGEG